MSPEEDALAKGCAKSSSFIGSVSWLSVPGQSKKEECELFAVQNLFQTNRVKVKDYLCFLSCWAVGVHCALLP